MLPRTTDKFIEEAYAVHSNKYDYSLVDYTNSKAHVTILCSVHGAFIQAPANHLSGQGCPRCGVEARVIKQCYDTETFVQKAISTHGTTYDYSLVDYTNSKDKVTIICKLHGAFLQEAASHLKGQGCRQCAFDRSNIAKRVSVNHGSTMLYYVYLPEFSVWKIGCTSRSIEERLAEFNTPYEVLYTKIFNNSSDAYQVERLILDATVEYSIDFKLLKSGNTEVRTKEITCIQEILSKHEV